MVLLPEQTIHYKTWIKTSLVEGLKSVFLNHPDNRIRTQPGLGPNGSTLGTKVSIDYPTSELHYPAVVIRFFEREIMNAGVGHVEYLYVDDESKVYKFRHYLYNGDIEFVIFALSSLDRDLISDSVTQTLAMPDMAAYTNNFWNRIYFPSDEGITFEEQNRSRGRWNYVNLNTDRIAGFGETQTPQPWLSEDQLTYQTSYRVGIYGEFYSLPPIANIPSFNKILKVNLYPYDDYILQEPPPTGTDDPAPWT
jgi:hypothetical protein